MKKDPNTITIKKGRTRIKRSASRSVSAKSFRQVPAQSRATKYSDGLVRIYKREEEDIDRFAAFAEKLISR